MNKALTSRFKRLTTSAFSVGFITALLIQAVPFHVYGADSLLVNRSDRISNPVAGGTSNHLFGLTMANSTQMVGSISFEFCANTPIQNTACVPSTGFSAATASLGAQTGDAGFSIHPNSTANRIVISRPPVNPTATPSTFLFTNITNPTTSGSHYVRLQTYTSADGTGIDIENGGVVYAISSPITVNAEVPPYIRFCVAITIVGFDCSTATSFLIDFGELSTSTTRRATSQFMVASNAASGYSVTASGTTLVSGNNVIPSPGSATAPQPGTSQFGMNLRANSNPSVGSEVVGPGTSLPSAAYNGPNQYKFANGDTLVSVGVPNSNRKFTVSYIANISPDQQPGVYATTISYICLANF